MKTMEGGLNERLKNKVELSALNDFSNTLNNKFVQGISQKIDKKELKVKTSSINKKVKF